MTPMRGRRGHLTERASCAMQQRSNVQEVPMSARIYSPAKTAMQSGKAKTGDWILDFDPEQPRTIDPLTGYTASGDMKSEISLTFETKDEAAAYAEKYGIEY